MARAAGKEGVVSARTSTRMLGRVVMDDEGGGARFLTSPLVRLGDAHNTAARRGPCTPYLDSRQALALGGVFSMIPGGDAYRCLNAEGSRALVL